MLRPDGLLPAMGERGTLLALLLFGYALLDFLILPSWMEGSRRKMVVRDLVVGAVTCFLCALPGLSIAALPFVLGLALWRYGVHALTLRMRQSARWALGGFVLDQVLQVAAIVVVWAYLVEQRRPELEGAEDLVLHLALLGAALAFNARGGAWLVRQVLSWSARHSSGSALLLEQRPLGRTIGMLERCLVLLLGIAGQWGAVGLAIAAKSVARFWDLEDRAFGEYYLVGTLSSLLLAVASALLLQVLAF